MNIYLRRNGPFSCFLPPHYNHQRIEQPSRLPLNTRLIDTLTPHFLSSNNLHLQNNTPLANAFTSTPLSADTTRLRPQGLQHQQPVMMIAAASPASSPISSMSSPSPPSTRSRNASYAARPQRPGPKQPPQPRDGDTRHMFNSVSASFAFREQRSGGNGGDGPQPRDPGNGRRSRDPHPRDPGGKRDPQPRDPGT